MRQAYTIFHIEGCSSLEDAVHHLIDELGATRDVYCQVHRLAPYQGFPVHKHFTTNEWIVVHDAAFDFVTHEGGRENVRVVHSVGKTTVICVPMGACHTVRSRASGLRYGVVKDGPDDFHLC